MLSPEDIYALYTLRRRLRGPLIARMEQIKEAYNGDMVVPLMELSAYERSAVPNLVAQGIDQTATRIASTTPNCVYPSMRPGIKKEDENARKRRSATLGWWEQNNMELKLRRRARWLQGYACAPVCIRPSALKQIPCWHVRDPLSTYPAPDSDPDSLTPTDCIFAFRKSLKWVDTYYPNNNIRRKRNDSPDTMLTLIEYMDAEQITLICLSSYVDISESAVQPISLGSVYNDTWVNTQNLTVLESAPNLAGIPPFVIPGRITLDRDQGQYDGIIGMYQAQALLFGLMFRATANDVWPDEWLISRPGEKATIISMADGRKGEIGNIEGGTIETVHSPAGGQAMQLIAYLDQTQHSTAGIPREFSGESPSNVRTGRRGDSILSAVVDFPIQEAQTLLAKSLEAENRIAVAIDLAYYGNDRKSFYVSWRGAAGPVDYIPSKIFTTDQNRVFFPAAGVDANNLTITLGQLVGSGLISTRSAQELHPFIDDAEAEHDRLTSEALERSVLTAIEQQAAQGAIPPIDVARIYELVLSDKEEIFQAIQIAQAESQARQASQAPIGSPALQPGLGAPDQGAEATPAIPPPTPSAENLASVLGSIYPSARGIDRPGSGTSPNDRLVRR